MCHVAPCCVWNAEYTKKAQTCVCVCLVMLLLDKIFFCKPFFRIYFWSSCSIKGKRLLASLFFEEIPRIDWFTDEYDNAALPFLLSYGWQSDADRMAYGRIASKNVFGLESPFLQGFRYNIIFYKMIYALVLYLRPATRACRPAISEWVPQTHWLHDKKIQRLPVHLHARLVTCAQIL